MLRTLAAIFGFLAAGFIVLTTIVLPKMPPNWIPWHEPVLDAAPTVFAHFNINRLRFDRKMCLNVLSAATKLKFTSEADRKIDGQCGYDNVVRVTGAPIAYSSAPIATCPLNAALYWWHHDLQGLAEEIFQKPIAKIEHVGTFACRNVNSEAGGTRSQHAYANAMDISGFVLGDGRRISVSDWRKTGREADFLQAAHKAACKYFNGALGPGYNARHADHFHLDLGPYLICK
jgi:hypothetical protein